jgi:tRNA(Arg) A34 adenosine deaminase TadA
VKKLLLYTTLALCALCCGLILLVPADSLVVDLVYRAF